MRTKLFLTVIACTILLTCSALSASSKSPRIGYVDVQEVLSKSRWGGEVEREGKKQMENIQSQLLEKSKVFKEKKDRFEKKIAVLDSKAKRKQSEELQMLEHEMNELYRKSQAQYSQLQEKLLTPLFGKLKEVIKQVANKDHYDYVLNKTTIMYYSGIDDLTNRVLVELNNATPANPLGR
jgi:outer membrane protein